MMFSLLPSALLLLLSFLSALVEESLRLIDLAVQSRMRMPSVATSSLLPGRRRALLAGLDDLSLPSHSSPPLAPPLLTRASLPCSTSE